MKILGKVEIFVSFITSLVAGKVATVMDSKIKLLARFQISKPHNRL